MGDGGVGLPCIRVVSPMVFWSCGMKWASGVDMMFLLSSVNSCWILSSSTARTWVSMGVVGWGVTVSLLLVVGMVR